ncbi:YeeE/YedE family protein [Pelomonas sp. P7]|uniref:YeeE/YedE family protein n=1 Tax=Pelomonas caseinilytica TaxID=2906763 RepID=A0ABS8XIT9_9BURK|nr:DUF6691 family protein [Pelomonas sp. P7]MCE4539678.1 YeeE/YedE family protein [Pelomonas sp. P7]
MTRAALQRVAAAALAGTVFGAGLAIAQMTDPRKVLNFLDPLGHWDASLAFVLGAALAVAALGTARLRRAPRPLLDKAFHLPPQAAVDRELLFGSALFGIGWGLAGYCPGPAFAALSLGQPGAWWLIAGLTAGTALARWQRRR